MVAEHTGHQAFRDLTPWGNQVSETLVNLDFAARDPDFSGVYSYLTTKDCVAARLFGTAHRTTRSQRKVREVDSDFVLLVYLKAGDASVAHRHLTADIAEKSFVVFDAARPHELNMPEQFDHLVLRIPKTRFLSLHPAVSSIIDRPIHGAAKELQAAASILDILVSMGGAGHSSISTMSDTVIRLLGEWVAAQEGDATQKKLNLELLAHRIMKCLEENYTDPDYSSARLATSVGISRRYVDSILAGIGTTFGRTLLSKRLERSHAVLIDPKMRNKSVTEIAMESGFNDLSHFSKRFREKYGLAPRSVREGARQPH